MSDYKVITAGTTIDLRRDVGISLDLGWEVLGPVQIQPNTEKNQIQFWYFQTMILK
jgi:hypothetical protein